MTARAVPLTELNSARYLSLTTFRRSGVPVATPVWAAQDGDQLLVWTARNSGKVKRIRHDARVTLASCTARGRLTGPEVPARAEILPAERTMVALDRIRAKYGLLGRVYIWYTLRRGNLERSVALGITLVEPGEIG